MIVNKITKNPDISDAIYLCQTNLISILSFADYYKVRGNLTRRISEHCLELFELGQYDEINDFYNELSKTELFSDRDVSDRKERTLFSLIDPKIRALLDDDDKFTSLRENIKNLD